MIKPITRPIHYLGSKLRIINPVISAINEADPSMGPVCDLFAGSGTMSYAFSEKRAVIAADIQEYSRVLCSALLDPVKPNSKNTTQLIIDASSPDRQNDVYWAFEPLCQYEAECLDNAEIGTIEPLCDFMENGSFLTFYLGSSHPQNRRLVSSLKEVQARLATKALTNSKSTMVTRYFGGVYFSYFQACQIDKLLEGIFQSPIVQRDTLLSAVLSTASEIVNTIGKQFAQPIRPRLKNGTPKAHLLDIVLRDRTKNALDIYTGWVNRYSAIPKTCTRNQVIKGDYKDVLNSLKGEVSVVYADPPYTRDHYSRYYHVLETMCLRDNPQISKVVTNGKSLLSRGIYRNDRFQSPFCIHSKVSLAFENLFDGVKSLGVPLILSYSPFENNNSRPRLLTIKQVEELARSYFKTVSIIKAGHVFHNKLTSSDKTFDIKYDAEVLFICDV